MATEYASKCQILAELWLNYRDDEDWMDFIQYNDLGLPLAYAIDNSIVDSSDMAENFINETFRLFLEKIGIEDIGFEMLDDILELDTDD